MLTSTNCWKSKGLYSHR